MDIKEFRKKLREIVTYVFYNEESFYVSLIDEKRWESGFEIENFHMSDSSCRVTLNYHGESREYFLSTDKILDWYELLEG